MGVPYSKSDRAQGRGPQDFEMRRERGSEGMGIHSPLKPMDEKGAGVWVSVQQGKWRVPPGAVSGSRQGPREGTAGRWARERSPPGAVDLPSRVSAPECKASAEQESEPQSRLEKGNVLEGKEKVTGS